MQIPQLVSADNLTIVRVGNVRLHVFEFEFRSLSLSRVGDPPFSSPVLIEFKCYYEEDVSLAIADLAMQAGVIDFEVYEGVYTSNEPQLLYAIRAEQLLLFMPLGVQLGTRSEYGKTEATIRFAALAGRIVLNPAMHSDVGTQQPQPHS